MSSYLVIESGWMSEKYSYSQCKKTKDEFYAEVKQKLDYGYSALGNIMIHYCSDGADGQYKWLQAVVMMKSLKFLYVDFVYKLNMCLLFYCFTVLQKIFCGQIFLQV